MVASDRMEFAAFGNTLPGLPQAGVDWSRRVQLNGNDLMLIANGVGVKRAVAAAEAGLAEFDAGAIVSAGFCGALSPDLNIADIVAATNVTNEKGDFPALLPSCARSHHRGTVVTVDHVAQTAAEKCALRAQGAIAVEMEASGVGALAQRRALPFYCIRVVTDLAGEDMANDFNAVLRSDGHFDTINLLARTMRKPFVRLPELLRLRRRCARAARTLGEFVADCRF